MKNIDLRSDFVFIRIIAQKITIQRNNYTWHFGKHNHTLLLDIGTECLHLVSLHIFYVVF